MATSFGTHANLKNPIMVGLSKREARLTPVRGFGPWSKPRVTRKLNLTLATVIGAVRTAAESFGLDGLIQTHGLVSRLSDMSFVETCPAKVVGGGTPMIGKGSARISCWWHCFSLLTYFLISNIRQSKQSELTQSAQQHRHGETSRSSAFDAQQSVANTTSTTIVISVPNDLCNPFLLLPIISHHAGYCGILCVLSADGLYVSSMAVHCGRFKTA